MNVLIVDCLGAGSTGRRFSTLDVIGAGPRLVAGVIESLGHRVDLATCDAVIRDPESLKDLDVLMVSGMSSDLRSMARVVRSWGRGPAVAGGPSAVNYVELINSGFTHVVWGEAELCIDKLLRHFQDRLSITEVPNIVFKRGQRVIKNPGPSYTPTELLWRSTPSTKLVTRYDYWWCARVYVEVVRGCSNYYRPTLPLADGRRCTECMKCRKGGLRSRLNCPLNIPPGCGYCSVPALYGPARSRPIDSIVKEVSELIKIGVKRIVLSAPDFLDYGRDWLVYPAPLTDPRYPPPNLQAIQELLERLTEVSEVSSHEVYIMIENVKPNLVNEKVARILGMYLRGTTVHLGLETGCNKHHIVLGRPSTVDEVLRAASLLAKEGLRPYVYVIHGLPGESKKTIKETIKVVKKLPDLGVEKITLYRFTPLKGTAFEGFSRPPPAVKSQARKLYYTIRRINYVSKKKLVGQVLRAVGVATKAGDALIAYTLPHGPVIKVLTESPEVFIGKTLEVVITRVLSDRAVEGRIKAVLN